MPRTRRGDVHDALEHLVSPGNGANLDSCREAVKFVPSVAEDVYVRRGPLGALRYAAVGLLSITIAGAAISSRTADWRPLWLFLTLLVLGVAGDRVVQRWCYSWDGGHVRGIDLFTVAGGKVTEKLSYVKG